MISIYIHQFYYQMDKDLDLNDPLGSKTIRTKLLHFRTIPTAMFGRAKDDSPTEFFVP
jgi:hypothetical protein